MLHDSMLRPAPPPSVPFISLSPSEPAPSPGHLSLSPSEPAPSPVPSLTEPRSKPRFGPRSEARASFSVQVRSASRSSLAEPRSENALQRNWKKHRFQPGEETPVFSRSGVFGKHRFRSGVFSTGAPRYPELAKFTSLAIWRELPPPTRPSCAPPRVPQKNRRIERPRTGVFLRDGIKHSTRSRSGVSSTW